MSTYIIKGGNRLEGKISISWSKNEALPIIAANILNAGKTKQNFVKVLKYFWVYDINYISNETI